MTQSFGVAVQMKTPFLNLEKLSKLSFFNVKVQIFILVASKTNVEH